MTWYKLFTFGINFVFFISLIVLFFAGYFLRKKRKKFIGITIIFTAIMLDLFLSTQAVLLTSPRLSVKTQTIPTNTKIYTIPPDQRPQTTFFRPDIEKQFAKQKRELLLPNQNIIYGIYSLDGYASMAIAAYINQFTNASNTVTGLGKLEVNKIDFYKHSVDFIISDNSVEKINSRERYFLDREGTIQVVKETPTNIVFAVNAKTDTQLNILDTWYPGWKATIDYKTVSVENFENIYKKISVPEGNHVIRLYFYPKSFVIGSIITIVFIISVTASLPFIKDIKI